MICPPGPGTPNPYEPPAPGGELPIEEPPGWPSAPEHLPSVTFRVSLDDLKRAGSGGMSPVAMTGFVVLLVMLGISVSAVPPLGQLGWTTDAIRVLVLSALPAIALVGAILWVGVRRRARGAAEAPFETCVILTQTALIIREAGIAELRRLWPGVSGVSHNRHCIRFEFLMFDTTAGRFEPQAGPIVPLRAFESEADAAAFLATARALIESSDRLRVPG